MTDLALVVQAALSTCFIALIAYLVSDTHDDKE